MKWLRKLILWILILLLVIALICGTVWYYVSTAFSTLSSRESALNETRLLLSTVAQKPTGPMPDDLPGYLRVNDDCWIFLQQGMNKNANHYTLTVTKEYDSYNDPNSVHQLIEVWINIYFPDGQRAEMYYSQGSLTGCRER